MLEWLKRHAWKACIRQKRIASSNLAHSANKTPKINDLNVDFQGLFGSSRKHGAYVKLGN